MSDKMHVETVGEWSVVIRRGTERYSVEWPVLRAAAVQDDAALRMAYAAMLEQAEAMAAEGPVVAEVGQDATNVWWVASFAALYGGGPANVRRHRDEGGTHPNQMLAAIEAHEICTRLGARVVRRVGFNGPAEVAAARLICDSIRS